MRIGLLAVMSLSLLVACDLNAKHCPTVPPETSGTLTTDMSEMPDVSVVNVPPACAVPLIVGAKSGPKWTVGSTTFELVVALCAVTGPIKEGDEIPAHSAWAPLSSDSGPLISYRAKLAQGFHHH